MKVIYQTSFFRDTKKSPKILLADLDTILLNLETVTSLKNIDHLKKLKGHKSAYRIKLNNYRLCFYYQEESIIIARFLPRKDVYKVFP
jgi:mRNA interferase RelE/StbE